MKLAVVTPDFGITGGFERLVSRLVNRLEAGNGLSISRISLDARHPTRRPFGLIPPAAAPHEFVRYAALAEAFAGLDLGLFDAVVSTSPPSYAVHHPRHLALFYHHQRIYYDLSDIYVAAGFVDHRRHAAAQQAVRRMDDRYFDGVGHFLAGSASVAERLARFGRPGASIFHAGLTHPMPTLDGSEAYERPLCVSRHEFPKRTELFALAMKLLPELEGDLVGGGGRLGWVIQLDASLTDGRIDPADVDDAALWRQAHSFIPDSVPHPDSNVRFPGRVSDSELDRLYRQALCVVAPAYEEDYGLTALEAMAYAKPVIVCHDGGGLTELVEHGRTGLVVTPTGAAIADAIRLLSADREYARQLGAGGRRTAETYTWERALTEFRAGLEQL